MRKTIELLCDLIRYPSTSGKEEEVIQFIAQAFEPVVDEVELVPIPATIVDDPDYSSPIPGINYDGRYNVRAIVEGSGEGKSLILNAHCDVVPPSKGQDSPFAPVVREGFVHGRGACDDKGQIAVIWKTLRDLEAGGVKLKGNLSIHIVVEEENGGNGTLALVRGLARRGESADGVIVLEPTDLQIVTSSRGAVWFRIKCLGRPGHVGSAESSISALKSAINVMGILEAYHDRLLAESRDVPLFDECENPMPVTVGKLNAGRWPATVPGEAVLEGVFGFLPNRTKEQVMAEIRQLIIQQGDPWLREHFSLDFTFRHDGHVTPPDAPIVACMEKAVESCGEPAILSGMPGSSDTWLYNNQLGIPSILFGAGKLADAHSSHEMVSVDDIEKASDIMRCFICDWCNRGI